MTDWRWKEGRKGGCSKFWSKTRDEIGVLKLEDSLEDRQ